MTLLSNSIQWNTGKIKHLYQMFQDSQNSLSMKFKTIIDKNSWTNIIFEDYVFPLYKKEENAFLQIS